MHIVVRGSGVVGTTRAHLLGCRGHAVTVVEKAASPGQATSYANGGQLSYSYTDSLADPALLPKIPGLLAGRNPAFELHPAADPALLNWGTRFLRNCTTERARFNTATCCVWRCIHVRCCAAFKNENRWHSTIAPAASCISTAAPRH